MALRVLRGNPHYTPKRRRPLCSTCLAPATVVVIEFEARTRLALDGTPTRAVAEVAAYSCDAHG